MNAGGDSFLAPVGILGVGAITPQGRELPMISRKLGEAAPSDAPVLRVADELFSDPAIHRRMRRADRLGRMAAVAAMDAWNAAKSMCGGVSMEKVGLIVATGFGPHCRGFRFLDGILDCGDSDALPTDFSQSVHGAAGAYISELLEMRGPSLTMTDFETGFEQTVVMAQCWLSQGVCDRVLVGAVEEVGEVLLHVAGRMWRGPERLVPGEGAVFLALGHRSAGGIAHLRAAGELEPVDLVMLDVPAIGCSGRGKLAVEGRCRTTFSPYFGHTPNSSAFQLLGGLLSLQAGRPLGQLLGPMSDATAYRGAVDSAATFKPSCDPCATSLLLTKI